MPVRVLQHCLSILCRYYVTTSVPSLYTCRIQIWIQKKKKTSVSHFSSSASTTAYRWWHDGLWYWLTSEGPCLTNNCQNPSTHEPALHPARETGLVQHLCPQRWQNALIQFTIGLHTVTIAHGIQLLWYGYSCHTMRSCTFQHMVRLQYGFTTIPTIALWLFAAIYSSYGSSLCRCNTLSLGQQHCLHPPCLPILPTPLPASLSPSKFSTHWRLYLLPKHLNGPLTWPMLGCPYGSHQQSVFALENLLDMLYILKDGFYSI